MPTLYSDVDPDGLLEYSVVYTDRALNHMSQRFQAVMNDLSSDLKHVYNAHSVAIIPGSGTCGMEAIARQVGRGKTSLIIRNGWFSYRWTQIMDKGGFGGESTVLCASQTHDSDTAPFAPPAIEDVIEAIQTQKPDLVIAPHVETSAGMLLPEAYIKQLGDAAHAVGALLVIDCIASGALWLDMQELGIDFICSAPQKGWTSTPCAGLVMMSEQATKQVDATESDSFSLDLQKWLNIMRAYENGGHAYHATMPTDGLHQLRDTIVEAKEYGLDKLKQAQIELGTQIRQVMQDKNLESVAVAEYASPTVVVSYTDDDTIHKGNAFVQQGMQIAAGVPLAVGEPDGYKTFRVGLFGLDKLYNLDRTVSTFADVLDKIVD